MVLKPQKDVFILRTALIGIAVCTALAGVAMIATAFISLGLPLLIALAWVVFSVFLMYRAKIVYRKEQYEVLLDRIIVRRGGLVSDAEVELQLDHVTHVKWIRPWLRHKFFGTGNIIVEAAGSATSSVILRDLGNTEAVHAQIRTGLRNYSFSMSTENLLHREAPADLGIVAEMIAGGIGGFFGLAFIFGPIILPAAISFPPIILLAPILAGIGVIALVLHYFDLKRRVYSVYDGLVEYHEGFLTRNDAFMPIENLSNSEISRNLIERLTNLHQVKISCQGAGQEITFKHLEHGPELDQVIKEIIDTQSRQTTTEEIETHENAADKTKAVPETQVVRDKESTGRYRMHGLRTMLPYLLSLFLLPLLIIAFPLLIGLIIGTVYAVIKIKNTTYYVNKSTIAEEFDFITSKTREFTTDKITGITFRESIIDKWFDTCSIAFWSIGAADEIAFRNIPKHSGLYEMTRAKAGICPQEDICEINSNFSLQRYLAANFFGLLFAGLLILAGSVTGIILHSPWAFAVILIAFIPAVAYSYRRVYYRRSMVTLFKSCIEYRRGLIIREWTYALYPNVKDISTTKHPCVDSGSMRFNVAGEKIRKTNNGEVRIPYGFTFNYAPEILKQDDVFDQLLLGRSGVAEAAEPLMVARKAPANTVVVVCLICLPVLPLLPLVLGIALWRVSLVRYIVEPDRVLMRKGALYRKQTSIIYDRIDHIQTKQNVLNKMFKNGNIIINTAGSSKPELILSAVPNWRELHTQLRKQC
ncbi:MAG: PH domain-containing protein [Lentisphaeria bacterium]